ncbi:MAG TPA: AAA family ATPase [Acidimicrobiales bacterium]|nr:AAA family ATPase [Acidimicrobiales bacterium]
MPELVGREVQQAAIDRLLDGARRGRSGALVVRGDAGIGKSALLDHAVGSATATGMRVVRGVGIESEAELPFGALHLLLYPFLDRLDRLAGPQATAMRIAFGLADGPAPSRFLVGAGTLGLLAELSADEPLLCVVDDAQWLDQSSSDALLFAARRFQVDPVAMLFAARHAAVPFAAPGVASLEVTGLPAAAAAGLLDGQAPGLAAPLRDRVLAEAGGNPLAIIELGTTRRAAQDTGTFDPAEQVGPLQVTWRVQETFRTQIAGLPEATRLALEVAAADSAARLDVILRAMAAVGASPGDLEPAEQARLISLSTSGLTFRHPLIRGAAYQHAPHHRRVAVHRAFANAETDTDRRAWHLAAATTAPDEAVAAELERTAERAEARGGAMAVSAAYDRSARLSTDPELKAVRLVKAAHAAYAAGHPGRAERLATEAESLTGDRSVLADAVFLRAQVRYERVSPEADGALALQAADLVPDDDPGRAGLILIEAMCAAKDASDLGLLRQAVEHLQRLRLPEGSDQALANAAMIAWADVLDGRPERAVAPIGQLLRRAREQPLEDLHRVVAGFSALLVADDEAAVAVMSAMVDDARAHGKLTWIPYALELLALGHMLRGDLAAAQTCLGEGVPLAEELGMTTQTAVLRSIAVWLAAVHGDEDGCRSQAAAVRPKVAGRHPGSAALVTWGLGLLDLAAGRFDAALDQLEDVCRGAVARDLPIRAVADLVEAAVRAGQPDRAQAPAADLERWAEHAATPTAQALALRCRALLDDDGAEGLLAEAVERCASPYDRARVQLLSGEWLRRRRRRTEAGTQLQAATEGFEKLGADRWAQRARTELAALGARPLARPHAADPATRLTPQELQVVRLAAAGLTNKEIAAQMYLSPRTIGHHLSNVFPKLGVSRRTELATLDL